MKYVYVALGLLVLAACTAAQRGWAHDNVPLIGALFTPLVPPPAIPWYNALLHWIGDQFATNTTVAVTATGVAVATGKQFLTKAGIPGTKKHTDHKKKIAATQHSSEASSK